MASELKLSGSAGGRIIVQGNDTITTDQTFTFPDTGGELATAPAGGSAVGYQQGLWTPRWVQGVTPNSYVSTFGRWSRIGNTVFIAGRIQGEGGGSDGNAVRLGQLPYAQQAGTGEGAVTIGYPGGLFGNPSIPFWALITSGEDYMQFFYQLWWSINRQ